MLKPFATHTPPTHTPLLLGNGCNATVLNTRTGPCISPLSCPTVTREREKRERAKDLIGNGSRAIAKLISPWLCGWAQSSGHWGSCTTLWRPHTGILSDLHSHNYRMSQCSQARKDQTKNHKHIYSENTHSTWGARQKAHHAALNSIHNPGGKAS